MRFQSTLDRETIKLPTGAVMTALAAALLGWAPRALRLVWLLLAWAVAVFYFAKLLNWPEWATTVSPFDHVAPRPAQHGDTRQVLWLGAAALTLLTAGRQAADVDRSDESSSTHCGW